MTADDDLTRILGALDDPDDETPPPYADALWTEVRGTLERDRQIGAITDTAVTSLELLDEDEQGRSRLTRRRVTRLAVAAGAAAALIVAVAFFDRPNEPPPQVTTAVSTPTPDPVPGPRLTDPAQACLRYQESEPSLAQLQKRVDAGDAEIDELDAAVTALEMLRADLTASAQYRLNDLISLDLALGALAQARAELDTNEPARASRSIESAGRAIERFPLPAPTADSQPTNFCHPG